MLACVLACVLTCALHTDDVIRYADEYINHIFMWRIVPTFVFGFLMLFLCQIYNICNCRSM